YGAKNRRRRPATPAGNRRRRALALQAKELLAAKYAETLRLDPIADELRVSSFHLCRTFKDEIGVTMHRYLNGLRLRASLGRLAGGEAALTALALALGFSSHSHFSAAFRREFSISPSDVRSTLSRRSEPPAPH